MIDIEIAFLRVAGRIFYAFVQDLEQLNFTMCINTFYHNFSVFTVIILRKALVLINKALLCIVYKMCFEFYVVISFCF